MKKIKVKDVPISIPEKLEDITTKEFIRFWPEMYRQNKKQLLDNEFDLVDFVANLLNIDYDLAMSLNTDVLETLNFIINLQINELLAKTPQSIVIRKKTIQIPKRWQDFKLIIGQIQVFEQTMKKIENQLSNENIESLKMLKLNGSALDNEQDEILHAYYNDVFNTALGRCDYISGIVIAGLMDEDFSFENVEKIQKSLLSKPFTVTLPLAFFLLIKFRRQLTIAVTSYHVMILDRLLTRLRHKTKK